jgi:hypothetical protein
MNLIKVNGGFKRWRSMLLLNCVADLTYNGLCSSVSITPSALVATILIQGH